MKNRTSPARRGTMLILVAVVMVIFVAMTVISIDVAKMHLIHTELRTATDAATRAAAESLTRTQNVNDARNAAKVVAGINLVNGEPLQLANKDIIFGSAVSNNRGVFSFQAGANPTNSVRINGRRTSDSPSGSVPLFMGGILGTGSFEPTQTATSTSFVRDIALVVDRSGSMRGSKIAALKNAVREFVDILEVTPADERISLSSYSSSSSKDSPLSGTFGNLKQKNNALLASGTTAIGEGLEDGLESVQFDPLARSLAEKTVVLMTDGNENTGRPVLSIVPQAIAANVSVHTITFGQGADESLMKRVADATGGRHLHANTNDELRAAFKEIAESLAVVMIE